MGDKDDKDKKKKSSFARLKSFRSRKLELAAPPSVDGDDVDSPADPQKLVEELVKVQVELRELKGLISHQSKKNFTLERDVRFFDSKIALLINHKISVEELEKRVFEEEGSLAIPGAVKDIANSELYGNLFFRLQTSPEYIARLTRLVTLREIDGLLQMVMFSLYGNQYEDREEHLLLSMFEHALTYEVQEATEINSLMRANTAITRMMTNYCRRGPGQEYAKASLGEMIQKVISCDKSFEIDPMKILEEMIDNEELERPAEANLLLEMAESNPKVQQLVRCNTPHLQDCVLGMFQRLRATIDDIPFGIRWLCKATRSLVQEKFPNATSDQINSFIGGFFFLRYMNPIIATPHAYQLASKPPPQLARRNLTLVAKLIQKLANTSSVREKYMLAHEPFVRAHHEEFKRFLSDLCEVPDFHEALQLEEYIALCRKDIWIEVAVSEVGLIHKLFLKYQGDLISSEDSLCELLQNLPEPTDEMLSKRNAILRLDLIQHSRENLDVRSLTPTSVLLETKDDPAITRRQCKHLLIRLFKMAPHCLIQPDLQGAVAVSLASPLNDVVKHAELTSEHLQRLERLGGLERNGTDLFGEIKQIFPDQHLMLRRVRHEVKSLRSVRETMMEHADFLQEQLDAYKEYLVAVRAKVGEMRATNSYIFRKPKGTYQFSHAQLERDGVILETPGIPSHRRGGVFYSLSCLEPGTYSIAMHHKGHQRAIYEKTIHLEDLLELQFLRDPVLDLEGFVVLNVRQTHLLLNRCFVRRESVSSRPLSRHFSSSSTLNFTKNATASSAHGH